MAQHIKCRWTPDGLCEMTCDVDTLRVICQALRASKVPRHEFALKAILHTLAYDPSDLPKLPNLPNGSKLPNLP
jgi:hypothetical protein